MRFVIIGGDAAGMSAASKARETSLTLKCLFGADFGRLIFRMRNTLQHCRSDP